MNLSFEGGSSCQQVIFSRAPAVPMTTKETFVLLKEIPHRTLTHSPSPMLKPSTSYEFKSTLAQWECVSRGTVIPS